MDCAGLEIASLNGIEEFSRLQRLDCSDNALSTLDLSACRSLRRLDCSGNLLPALLLPASGTLVSVLCAANDLVTLDISHCALAMQTLNARGNARLGVLYVGASQRIADLQIDGGTVVERR